MYVEQLKENDNIVNVNTIKVFKLTKFSIYYSLNVDKKKFEFYNNDIELFFVSINNKEKFMFVFKHNQELQKKGNLFIKFMCL